MKVYDCSIYSELFDNTEFWALGNFIENFI